MNEIDIFKNIDVAIEVFEEIKLKMSWYSRYKPELPRNNPKAYDERDLIPLSYLLIDVESVPEGEREEYYRTELYKMVSAFDNCDPETKRPYPEAIAPYLSRMYGETMNGMNNDIDWNDKTAVRRYVNTMLLSQSINSLFIHFSDEYLKLYPSVQEREKMDAIYARQTIIFNQAGDILKQKGIDIKEYNALTLTSGMSNGMRLNAAIGEKICNATLDGSDVINIDPSESKLMSDYFLGKRFSRKQFNGFTELEEDYTSQMLSTEMMDAFIDTAGTTVIESALMKTCRDHTGGDKNDMLLINGVPLSQIEKQLGLSIYEGNIAAARILQEALTDGKSVVELVRVSFNENRELHFRHQAIKVDLDKLNREDYYKNHNVIRRFLDSTGIWKIHPKYASNAQRDEAQRETALNERLDEKHAAVEASTLKSLNSVKGKLSLFAEPFKLTPRTESRNEGAVDESALRQGTENGEKEHVEIDIEDIQANDKEDLSPPIKGSVGSTKQPGTEELNKNI